MNLFRPILGLGFLAGAAIAAVKLVQMFDRIQDGEWTAVMGEMPEPQYTVPAPQPEEAETSAAAPQPATPAADPEAQAEEAAVEAEPAAPEAAPEAEAKEPERVTVHPRRAPIARAEDFQDWDDFGCRG